VSPDVEKNLRKFKRVTLNVSLDGTGSTFEAVRIGADFGQVRDNIRKLRAIARSSKSPDSVASISMCVMKSNVKDLANVIRFAAEEEISYGLSPVATEPQDESLACFNDPHTETQGWQEAYDEARRVACDAYCPMHVRRWKDKIPAGMDYRAELIHHIELVRKCTPWHLLDREHFRVRIDVPPSILADVSAHVPRQHRLMAYIYPEWMSNGGLPLYYAFLTDNYFEVSLPEGAYHFSVSSKWLWRGPVPELGFVVKKGRKKAKVVYSERLQPPTFWNRARKQLKVCKAAYAAWAKALPNRLRHRVKTCTLPYPGLFRLLKSIDSVLRRRSF
jgi:hypothetical protein